MFTKIRNRVEAGGGEGGFTLIELLVVIIIIAILAAIAIPMYLSQRQKGWRATVQSDLRNAAVAEESYFTDSHPSSYTTDMATLESNAYGFHKSADVEISAPTGDVNGYCLQADNVNNSGDIWSLNSNTGEPQPHACP